MRQVNVQRPKMNLEDERETTPYRAVSGMAVAALILGLCSTLALLSPPFWIVPLVAAIVALIALRNIARRRPELIGVKAAAIGLILSTTLASAGIADWCASRYEFRREARQFGLLFLNMLRDNEPHKAMQLASDPASRQPLDGQLWEFYADGSPPRDQLREFVGVPAIRTLLALGKNAEIRFYDTESQWADSSKDSVYQSYAVSFASEGDTKSFFFGLLLERSVDEKLGRAFWIVRRHFGGIRPRALNGTGSPPSG